MFGGIGGNRRMSLQETHSALYGGWGRISDCLKQKRGQDPLTLNYDMGIAGHERARHGMRSRGM